MRGIALVSLCAVALSVPAAAQQSADGQRLRIQVDGESRPLLGTLLGEDEHQLVLQVSPGAPPRTLLRQDVKRIEIGTRRSRGRGAWIGALLGLAVGVLAGAIDGDDPPDNFIGFSAPEKGLIFSVLTVPGGALIGLLVPPGERWSERKPDAVGTAPGGALRLALRF